MKYFSFFLVLGLITYSSCKKNNCNSATVVQVTGSCPDWAIRVNSVVYRADSIPDPYKIDGASFCVEYALYEDMRACACCGGTRARITSITALPE